MPRVKLPDGRIVDVPDDATPDQLSAFRAKLAAEFPDALKPKVDDAGLTEEQRSKARQAGIQAVSGRGGRATAAALGAGGGAFEAANALLRRNIKSNLGVTDDQAKALADEVLGAAARARPAAFGVGFAGGAMGTGGGVMKGAGLLSKAVPQASRVGQLLKALQFQRGQPIANALRTAPVSAAEAAAAATGRGEKPADIAREAELGGFLGPAVGIAARGATVVGTAARNLIDKNRNAGFAALATELSKKGRKVSADVLRKRADDFRRVMGRPPSTVELAQEASQDFYRRATARSGVARETLIEAADKRAVAAQNELAGRVERGRAVPATTKLERLRKVAADNAKAKIKDRVVHFDSNDLKALTENRDILRMLPDDERNLILELEDSGGALTIEQVDNIRQAIRKRGAGPGGPALKARRFAQTIVDDAARQVPEYGAFLKSYARRSEGIRGAELGQKVLKGGDVEFTEQIAQLKKPGLGGARARARGTLAEQARKSPMAAAELGRGLAEDAGLARRLEAVDPAEAAKLRELGQTEFQAARASTSSAAGLKPTSAAAEASDNIKTIAEALGVVSGRGSAGFVANFAAGLNKVFGVPPTASKRLAEALIDPARTDEVLDMLARYGIEPSRVEELARESARVVSRAGAPQASQE